MNSFLKKIIFRTNPEQPNFWLLHISSWIGFMIMDFNNNLYRISDTKGYVFWLVSDITGFLIVTGLRYIYKHYSLRSRSVYNYFGLLLICSLAGGIAWFFLRGLFYMLVDPETFGKYALYIRYTTEPRGIIANILFLCNPVFGWSLGYIGFKFFFNFLDERKRVNNAILDSKNTHLKMLRYQLNPHFLFNSLNSIQALMYKDVEKADKMLTQLSEFLRYTLRFDDKIYISLKDEVDIIQRFLFIEKIRFSDRIEYIVKVPKDLYEEKILCFITQPLVENAVKHGFKSEGNGRIKITIEAFKEDNWLVIRLTNTGKWNQDNINRGMGIKNVRERLYNAYKDKSNLSIYRDRNEVIVELKIQSINADLTNN